MKSNVFKVLAILAISLYSCKNNSTKEQEEQQPKAADSVKVTVSQAFNPADLPESPVFDIETTEGTIRVRLYKETPLHRDNFVKLASQKFYDGILFHRVIKTFMIQTGDPLTKDTSAVARYGQGGPGYTIPAEILPQFKHKKGALASARRGNEANPKKESSGSQFYIVVDQKNCASLDGDYTIFGETILGIQVVDKIAAIETGVKDKPKTDVKILSIKPVL